VLDRLGDPKGDVSRYCFEGVIELIYRTPAYELIKALAWFPHDANREALGVVTALPELDRDDGLVTLERLSLVNRSDRRFNLLPLTKEYVLSGITDPGESERLERQIVAYFQRRCADYSSDLWNWKNYAWLLPEGENVLGIVDWALAYDEDDVALSLTRATMRFLDTQGRWSELERYGEELYLLAKKGRDRLTLAWICVYWLGWLYAEKGDANRAEGLTREGLSFYRELGNVKGECLAMAYTARALRCAGKLKESRALCQEALELAENHEYGDGVASAHGEFAKLARDHGDWQRSRRHWEKAINWCEEHENEADLDISFLMGALGNLGWVEFQLDNPSRGKELIGRSQRFFTHMGGRGYATTLHLRMAMIEHTLGNLDSARKHAEETVFWAEKLGREGELRTARDLLSQIQTTLDN
jgi:tetratricopeptide (TPR) repeat protein